MSRIAVLDLQLLVQETSEDELQAKIAELGGEEQGSAWDQVDVERNFTFEFDPEPSLERRTEISAAINALPGVHDTAGLDAWSWFDDESDEDGTYNADGKPITLEEEMEE